jgi:hypothetical protein
VVHHRDIASALRQIGRGFTALAAAFEDIDGAITSEQRYREALIEWADRGLTREQASALLRKHGFAPQAAGGWARGDWIETRNDGLRYLTERSHRWIDEQGAEDVSPVHDAT